MAGDGAMRARVDMYGFEREEEFDEETLERLSIYLPIVTRRAMRWQQVYGQFPMNVNRSSKLKRFVRKGIPRSARPLLWMSLSGAEDCIRTQPDYYRQIIEEAEKSSAVRESVEMDLHRTFPENIYFCDSADANCLRQPLKRVLLAIAHKNKRIGYCQGLNFIAGLMLLVIPQEEDVFWLMDCLVNKIVPDYYNPDMVQLKAEQEFLAELVKWKCPEVAAHLENHGVSWMLLATKWFICLFADVLPTETTLRLWDCLLSEGIKVLYRAALTLVIVNQEKILAADSFPDIVNTFKAIICDVHAFDCHQFMTNLFKLPGPFPRSKLNQMREICVQREKGGK